MSIGRAGFAIGCWALAGAVMGLFSLIAFGSFITAVVIGLVSGLIVTALTIGMFSVEVPSQFAYVTINSFVGGPQNPDPNNLADFGQNHRIYPSGWHFRYPWETVQYTVDLQKETVVDSKDGDKLHQTYPTKDGVLMMVKWVFIARPRSGGDATTPFFLFNYLSHQESAVITSLKALVSQFLSDYFGRHNAKFITQNKAALATELSNLFGGDAAISPEERQFGVHVSNPNLSDADPDQDAQTAMSVALRGRTLQQAVATMVKKNPGLTPEKAMQALLVSLKLADQTYFDLGADVKGLQNLSSVSVVGAPLPTKKGTK